MKLTLGFSPCPNDTFIFDALVNKKIDTKGFEFDVLLEDVETLNRIALQNTLDITKISYGTLSLLINGYSVLDSGSALGTGVGPLLVANTAVDVQDIPGYTIAIPGKHTTAHMLFSLAYPNATDKIFMRFDEIENYVLQHKNKKVAGVIIHENRFTYHQKGLVKVNDLGDYWEQQTGAPIPLGGIVIKKNIEQHIAKEVETLIKESIEYSFKNYPQITEYVREHSQEMEEDVMRKHIDLYVNDYSLSLGEKGKNAIMRFLNIQGTDEFVEKAKIFL